MYDVTKDRRYPEQTFQLGPPGFSSSESSNRYSAPLSSASYTTRADVISFTLGHGNGDPWAMMTVWYLTSQGDIFASCPVLPHQQYVSLYTTHTSILYPGQEGGRSAWTINHLSPTPYTLILTYTSNITPNQRERLEVWVEEQGKEGKYIDKEDPKITRQKAFVERLRLNDMGKV